MCGDQMPNRVKGQGLEIRDGDEDGVGDSVWSWDGI